MGHVAQGGVSASLIAQLPRVLPSIGPRIAAVAIGVLVINTICGPLAMKLAIRALHEDGKLANAVCYLFSQLLLTPSSPPFCV